MGACAMLPIDRPLSNVPKMRWRARERWFEDKEAAVKTTADLLLEPPRMQMLLPHLYTSLGGTEKATSPIILKAGAAFVVYMTREVAFYGAALPSGVHNFAHAADLDFASRSSAAQLINQIKTALPWLAHVSADICSHWEEACPQWQLRHDNMCGEAFFNGRRCNLGRPPLDSSADLPIKLSFHGGLTERHTGTDFQLVRIGAAVWHKRLRRATTAAFVDVSLSNAALSTVYVMGMRDRCA